MSNLSHFNTFEHVTVGECFLSRHDLYMSRPQPLLYTVFTDNTEKDVFLKVFSVNLCAIRLIRALRENGFKKQSLSKSKGPLR